MRNAPLLAAVCGVLALAPASADVIHLEGGGTIETARWWRDGDWVRYATPAGVIGVPMSTVLRIEESAVAEWAAAAEAGGAPAVGRLPSLERQRREKAVAAIRAGTARLEERDFHGAAAEFYRAMNLDPAAVSARVGYAVAQLRLDRDGMALAVVRDGLVEHPDHPQLLELHGDLLMRDERMREAIEEWRRARDERPSERLDRKIDDALRDLEARGHFHFSASSHFNLRYDGDVDRDLSAAFLDYLEAEYTRLSGEFRHAPQQPIAVLLYTRQDFRTVTQTPDWVGGLYDGKIRVPLGGLDRLHGRAREVLTHELTHAFLHSQTRNNCPRWLHEGLAQWASGERTDRATRRTVTSALAELHDPADWPERQFSYGHALSLVETLLRRGGTSRIVGLLDALGDGQEIDVALRRLYGETFADLSRRWARELDATTAER